MPTIPTNDLDIAYTLNGPDDGPPVLLLHGWVDDASTWHAVGARRCAVPASAPSYRCCVARLYRSPPVVLTSGYSEVIAQGGTHGFELLHKPYSIDALSRALKKVSRRR